MTSIKVTLNKEGKKSGLFVGLIEAVDTGSLAGHNSFRLFLGMYY
ncbi:hypothetical protein [Abyssisolibacter fermentans]|nr:hypothetical protein [Abyssisolibacter fermentans]